METKVIFYPDSLNKKFQKNSKINKSYWPQMIVFSNISHHLCLSYNTTVTLSLVSYKLNYKLL